MILGFLHRIRWTVVTGFKKTPAGETFSSLARVMALPLPEKLASQDSESVVFLHHQDGQNFYVKRFHSSKGLRSWLGRSRLRGEWRNLKLFQRLGIPAAQLVAYGEERTLLLHAGRGALITEALENTTDLAHLAHQKDERLKNTQWMNAIIEQVATYARRMHAYRFAHNDFKWRNILVSNKPSIPKAFLIDCPSGQRWFGPFLKYRIIKDLACLDKLGKYNLSRTQRLRFFKLYRQVDRLSPYDKIMIRKITAFFEGRE